MINRKPLMKSSLFAAKSGKSNGGGGDHAAAEDVESVLRENDAMLAALGATTGRMAAEAGNLNAETRAHNAIVEQLLRGVGGASTAVRGTIQRLDGVMARHGCSGTATLAAAVFAVLLLLYFLAKWALHARAADAAGAGDATTFAPR